MPVLAGAVAMVLGASFPAAAQGIPSATPVPQTSASPLGKTSAIAREARGWLADLIKINTSNPPGNEQIAAMYVAGILRKEGITPEVLDLAPGPTRRKRCCW
jgi:hypothetical protein